MPRRVNMPGADELFRATAPRKPTPTEAVADDSVDKSVPKASGRVKHDEKMTVYLTSDELLAIEQTRLALRSKLGRSVDRGRLVRAAIAIALDDFDSNGAASELAQRLDNA